MVHAGGAAACTEVEITDGEAPYSQGPPFGTQQSRSIGKLGEALAKAQTEIENAVADSTNPHFRSKYADLASVREAAKPIAKHGLAVVQQVVSLGSAIGVRTVLLHTSGEWLASTVYVEPDKPGPQAAGSVITYLRRYSLAAALGIAQEDDDGNAASPAPPPARAVTHRRPPAAESLPPSMERMVTETAQDRARAMMVKHPPEGLGWDPKHAQAWLKKYFGVTSPNTLSQSQAMDASVLLATRMKTPELYPAQLEMFYQEERIHSGDYDK
jgi:hypothetical protein